MGSFIMETNRLRFRKMNEQDTANLLKIFSDSESMKFYPSTKGEEETKQWINWMTNHYHAYGIGLWIVEHRETSEFLGQCGFVLQKLNQRIEAELGYLFVRDAWGKGYGTEASLACKNYGFETLKLSKIVSLIDPENIASSKIAKKLGMSIESRIRKWDKEMDVYSVYPLM
ncbi:GNAT family N-acetyltransferase [Priestia megaterium]|nr:GNAT family N-acetyltransferase [Priestia megaterium]